MYRNFLISIGAFLAFAAMLAFAFRLGPFASALLIELLIGIAATEVLVHNLPSAIRSGIADNCRRANGRWSHRRARIEDRAVRKLRWNILYALLLVAIPLNAILWYVNGEVIPVGIGWDAVASIRLDSPWKENLRDEEADFDHWSRAKGLTVTEAETRKRILWRNWPTILAGLMASGIAAFLTLGAACFFALRELDSSIQYRAQQYRMQDYGRAEMRMNDG